MARPPAAAVVSPTAGRAVHRCHTAELSAFDRLEVRRLLDASFDDFSDADWDHGLGGQHVLVHDGDLLVAHGSLVQRRLLVGGRSLRCGYVEAVAVLPGHRRRGHASTVMEQLEDLDRGYDLLALSASTEGEPLYAARGWTPWRGPTSVLTADGVVPTPDDDGGVLVLGGPDDAVLDLDAPLTCDWRPGDVW